MLPRMVSPLAGEWSSVGGAIVEWVLLLSPRTAHYSPTFIRVTLALAASTRYADLEAAAAAADERIVAAAVAAAEAAAEATVAVVAATPATDAIVVAAAGGGAAPRTLGESLLATENLLLVGCAPPRTSPHP